MGEFSGRAEDIAAFLVSRTLGAEARKFDIGGKQSAVDFTLGWPDGRRGALEVTLVMHPSSSAWQGLAAKDGWRWPAPSGWEFRLHGDDMPYRRVRRAVSRAVALCDLAEVETLDQLRGDKSTQDLDIDWLSRIGTLRRAPWGSPGVVLLPASRAEFVETAPADFASVIENWLLLPHIPRHIDKAKAVDAVQERHLFLIPVDDVLPARFFTNDFPAPTRRPKGFGGLDGIWVWSNFWHQCLAWVEGGWRWLDFPARDRLDS